MTLISLAPLQGYTDFVFRNALAEHIGGIDKYYSPYLRLQNDKTIKRAQERDILPENNNAGLIPQILCNTKDDFLWFSEYLENKNYPELNWNLGCPYPMVAKRKLGSGLIPYPNEIDKILDYCIPRINIKISIKIRLGYENPDEIFEVLKVLNQYPIHELIIHPRIGKELYKNPALKEYIPQIIQATNMPIAYNGDILTPANAIEMVNNNASVKHLMIGRGLLKNPFLAREIKESSAIDEQMKREAFSLFYQSLHSHYNNHLSGDSHQINKLIHLWEYFSHLFVAQKKIYKRLKKIKKADTFYKESTSVISNEAFI